MLAQFKRYLDPLFPHQLQKKKKTVIKFGPPLTKLSGSAHANVRPVYLIQRICQKSKGAILSVKNMRGSRNFRQGGGGPSQSDKKSSFFSPQLILLKSNGYF